MNKEILKAIYIDDDSDYLNTVKNSLEKSNHAANYIVTTFNDPAPLFEFILKTENHYDIFLIDYDLKHSQWNGLGIAEEIRKIIALCLKADLESADNERGRGYLLVKVDNVSFTSVSPISLRLTPLIISALIVLNPFMEKEVTIKVSTES